MQKEMSSRPWPALSAGELCTRTVVYADAAMLIGEAARLMRAHRVGSLPVVEERSPRQRIVVGMLTDRDIASAVVAADRDPHSLRVGDVMSADVVTAREGDSVLDLLEVMRRKRVRRVPVVGAQGELIGLVALDDLLAVIADQMRALAAAVGAAQHHEPEPGRGQAA